MSQTVSAANPLGTEKIAERLGVPFYDKEIIKTVAERSGLAENYDLCLNSSKLGIDGCVDLILNCCK